MKFILKAIVPSRFAQLLNCTIGCCERQVSRDGICEQLPEKTVQMSGAVSPPAAGDGNVHKPQQIYSEDVVCRGDWIGLVSRVHGESETEQDEESELDEAEDDDEVRKNPPFNVCTTSTYALQKSVVCCLLFGTYYADLHIFAYEHHLDAITFMSRNLRRLRIAGSIPRPGQRAA